MRLLGIGFSSKTRGGSPLYLVAGRLTGLASHSSRINHNYDSLEGVHLACKKTFERLSKDALIALRYNESCSLVQSCCLTLEGQSERDMQVVFSCRYIEE